MSETLCVTNCGRPAEGYYLCRGCAEQLGTHLASIATLTTELDTNAARLARTSQPVPVATSGPAPLPFDPRAVEAMSVLHNTVTTWARILSEHTGHPVTGDTDTEMAQWLRARMPTIRIHPAAAEITDEISHAVTNGWQAVDRAPGKIYIGPCGADLDGGPCMRDLYARADPARPGRPDPRQTTVRCPCGAQWDAEQRRAWVLDRLHESLATAREIASAVGMINGRHVNERTIRTWHHRGRIIARGHNANGVPLHRIGDVAQIIAKTGATRRHEASEPA